MCYTLANNTTSDKLEKRLQKTVKPDLKVNAAVFNSGFSHPSLYIVKSEDTEQIDTAKWGLIPSFITDEIKANEYFIKTLNARAETIFEKTSFKDAIFTRRCLVPSTGFFEWRTCNNEKYPYYIQYKNEDVFCFAGIYDYWKNSKTGEITSTFSIVTTDSNPLMSKIHNLKKRQPLMLRKENENDWLKNDLKQNDIIELMQPLDEKYMTAYTIKKIEPKKVNIFSEDVIKEYEYPELVFFED
jgi:putative SOS response-associated peptidase YedK